MKKYSKIVVLGLGVICFGMKLQGTSYPIVDADFDVVADLKAADVEQKDVVQDADREVKRPAVPALAGVPAVDQGAVLRSLAQRQANLLMDSVMNDYLALRAKSRQGFLSDEDQSKLALVLGEMHELVNRGYDVNKIWAGEQWIDDEKLLDFCFKNGASLNFLYIGNDGETWTPLVKAITSNRRDLVEKLVNAGADVNARVRRGADGGGVSPLAVAGAIGASGVDNSRIVDFLEINGAIR